MEQLLRIADQGERRRQKRAVELVRTAVTAVGVRRFNLVWRKTELAPSLAEFRDPEDWVGRLRAA